MIIMFQTFFLSCLLSLFLSSPLVAHADALTLPKQASSQDLNPNVTQPYIIKKGDTLWDIANYFFKEPTKWLNIWEKNLYITNPDLIYPGNKIWLKAPSKPVAPAPTFHPQPEIIIKAAEHLSQPANTGILLTALNHQDFISPSAEKGMGYVVGSKDDRLNFGINDAIYLKIKRSVHIGDRFDIFRTGSAIPSLDRKKTVVFLIHHVGTVTILSEDNGIYRGRVTEAFREIMIGDRLQPAEASPTHIIPIKPSQRFSGHVLYIQNRGTAAGQNQTIGINLGLKDGLKEGMTLSIYRSGRHVKDPTKDQTITLPEEVVANIIVMKVQQDASLALITYSTSAVHIDDIVANSPSN